MIVQIYNIFDNTTPIAEFNNTIATFRVINTNERKVAIDDLKMLLVFDIEEAKISEDELKLITKEKSYKIKVNTGSHEYHNIVAPVFNNPKRVDGKDYIELCYVTESY